MIQIGIEIECPFSFYYPDIYQAYFKSGKKWHERSFQQIRELEIQILKTEPQLLQKLKTVSQSNGLKRGQDRYWEFVFPPETDSSNHLTKIDNLIKEDCLPSDMPLSVHFTISGINRDTAYSVLLFLQKEYLTKERLFEGFGEYFMPAWGKKLAKTGVLKKNKDKLIDAECAYQLRTLKVKMSDMKDIFSLLNRLLNNKNVVEQAKKEVAELGLEWKAWGKEDFVKFSHSLKG